MPIDFKQQTALFNPPLFEHNRVTIVGLGNIGSHVALTLARMGVQRITLFDDDTVENHNLSSQSYGAKFIGVSKVEAIAFQIGEIDPLIQVRSITEKYQHHATEDIVVIGVDSLVARREIAQILEGTTVNLIIDGRIGGEQLEVYNCKTIEEWKKTIPDGEAGEEPCGGKYIAYVSVMIAGLIANQVKKFLREETLNTSMMMNVNSFDVIKNYEW